MTCKPVIGITKPDNEDLLAFSAFWAAIKLAGGEPLVLTAADDRYKSANINGLLLGGGKDIFPGLYDQSPKDEYAYDRARDEMEVYWAERARDEQIPALGICRGAQLMNVVCGGTLHISVAEAYEDAHYPDGLFHHAFYRKTITIELDSILYAATGRTFLDVNSIHKQAIADLGTGLKVNAREDNGVIQGIAHKDHPFFLGIQFHPEFMIYRRVFRRIFEALVAAAKGTSDAA
jgi:putative glutamine amidotransferase